MTTCDRCKFSRILPSDQAKYSCHRFPPSPLLMGIDQNGMPQFITAFPIVTRLQSCAEGREDPALTLDPDNSRKRPSPEVKVLS